MPPATSHYAAPPPDAPLDWLRVIVAASPIGLMLVRAGKVFDCSAQCEQLLGLSPEEIHDATRLAARVRHPDGTPYRREDLCFVRALEQGEEVDSALMVLEQADGSSRLLKATARPVRGDGGAMLGAVVMVEDVTLQRDTEAKLRASESLLRTVIDILPVGVWITDREGRITLGNPAGQRIWRGARYVGIEEFGQYKGWRPDGTPIAAADWALARALRDGETASRELIRIQCFDGSFKTILNSAAPIVDPTNGRIGAIAVNEDVTALHEAQERLRAAVLDRERILATVSHDLRNPLASLTMWAASLREEASPDTAQKVGAVMDAMLAAIRRMSGLVDDLLAVSVSRAGQTLIERSAIGARKLFERAVEEAAGPLSREGLALRVEAMPGPLPTLEADAERILRVFANLADNARKFTARGGTVTFGAQAREGRVRFSVANSGPPIDADQLKDMFLPFWQAGREDARGAGLGMSISRAIVEAHGGSMWAEAAAGQRVRVCFELPAMTEQL